MYRTAFLECDEVPKLDLSGMVLAATGGGERFAVLRNGERGDCVPVIAQDGTFLAGRNTRLLGIGRLDHLPRRRCGGKQKQVESDERSSPVCEACSRDHDPSPGSQ
ncbi:MAG: hypothetical protein E6K70_18630 [Planctomycetota bacterium]|nr:MAG: hypothetical protein E6K70_18630 [Planctomycetota bacterium]